MPPFPQMVYEVADGAAEHVSLYNFHHVTTIQH